MKTFIEEFEAIKAEAQGCKPNNLIKSIKKQKWYGQAPFVIYGAGLMGKITFNYCKKQDIKVDYFCDQSGIDKFCGIPVLTPENLCKTQPNAVVAIPSWIHQEAMIDKLTNLGFASEQIIPSFFWNHTNKSFEEFEKYVCGYKWAFNYFEDERSKQTILNKIRLIFTDKALSANTDCDMYYVREFVSFKDEDVFVDGGSFDGRDAVEFLQKHPNPQNCKVYSFEPNKASFESVVKAIKGFDNVVPVQKGLWSTETVLTFKESIDPLLSSFVADNDASYSVPVTSLDVYFKDKDIKDLPTFIKLDVEGAEREALLGASEIIKKCKPKLAICAYHKIEDIYELAQTILSIRDDYKLGLVQHPSWHSETVLYGV
ncbi:MAG: FkbM family methyltransferase [Defluviitaleaceae bacterium]|nr:FkbM family methyltransferase [Defluviitaleaceae bacterium]